MQVKQARLTVPEGREADDFVDWDEPVWGLPDGARPIPGYPDYAVDPWGAVWSRKSQKAARVGVWCVLRTARSTGGYPSVVLHNATGRKSFQTHVLVASCFLGPRPPGTYVTHENGDPRDCRPHNLRYKTPKENQADRVRHNTHSRGARNGNATLNPEIVQTIRRLFASRSRTKTSIAGELGIGLNSVKDVLSGKSWRHLPPPVD